MMKDKMQWSIVAYPTVAWSKLFPEKSVEEAQEAMMEEILRINRVTGNGDLMRHGRRIISNCTHKRRRLYEWRQFTKVDL